MAQAERFSIIQRLLNTQRSVSFTTLQQRLGMSRATLYRDLRDLRDRMGVPIVFDRDTGRYSLRRWRVCSTSCKKASATRSLAWSV